MPDPELKSHQGGCHCGRVRYEVDVKLDKLITCNCSWCQKRGSMLAFAPAAGFRLVSGEDALTEYRFNRMKIQHLFCATCGIESFSRGAMPDGSPMVAVNARCLDGVEPEDFPTTKFNGRAI